MGSTYVEAQESYMDTIHLPDSHQAQDNWEKTLYAPLREFVGLCVTESDKGENFLYIGCGPKAPLLTPPSGTNTPFVKYFNSICLSDFSIKYLEECKATVNSKLLNKPIKTQYDDITKGLSDFFFYWLSNILTENSNRNSLYCQINFLNEHIGYFTDVVLKDKGSSGEEKYHYAYSEMVATYTGIPTIIYSEKVLNNRLEEKAISKEDFIELKELLMNIWRQYNDQVFKFHIKNLFNKIEDDGSIIIATDTKKIYHDKRKDNVNSLSSEVTIERIISESPEIIIKDKKTIEWDDSIRNEDTIDEEYLDPHVHEVLLVCLKKTRGVS